MLLFLFFAFSLFAGLVITEPAEEFALGFAAKIQSAVPGVQCMEALRDRACMQEHGRQDQLAATEGVHDISSSVETQWRRFYQVAQTGVGQH